MNASHLIDGDRAIQPEQIEHFFGRSLNRKFVAGRQPSDISHTRARHSRPIAQSQPANFRNPRPGIGHICVVGKIREVCHHLRLKDSIVPTAQGIVKGGFPATGSGGCRTFFGSRRRIHARVFEKRMQWTLIQTVFLSLLRSLISLYALNHGLRRGLHSFAASRLGLIKAGVRKEP